MTPLLELVEVSKRYGALTVADKLSLAVGAGEALGVIGPNGAGKTTFFNMIRPDAGAIRFSGSAITGMPPHLRCRAGIGRSYQIPHPFAKMTVFENLLVAAIYGARRAERESHQRCGERRALRLNGTPVIPRRNDAFVFRQINIGEIIGIGQ